MNESVAYVSDLEQTMLDHVEMVFSVAVQLTGKCADAEKLTRITLSQALRAPKRFDDGRSPKRELLKLLRRNFQKMQELRDSLTWVKCRGGIALAESTNGLWKSSLSQNNN